MHSMIWTWPATTRRHDDLPTHRAGLLPPPLRTGDGALVARCGRRIAGHVLDVVLLGGLLTGLGLAWTHPLGLTGTGGRALPLAERLGSMPTVAGASCVLLASAFVLLALLPAALGATPGQAVVGLRLVVHPTSAPVGLGRATLRWLTTAGLWLVPFGLLASGICALHSHRRATLHDLLAGTAVVRRPR